MKRSLKFPILLPLVLLMAFATSCGSSKNNANMLTDVRIAYFPNITHTQALVLKNRGTLEEAWKNRCNVKWTSFHAGPAEIEAIFAGEIDLGYIGPVPAINANIKSNGDVKIISNATNAGAALLVRNDAKIASIADLAGKKIAVPQIGNTQHLCLLDLLSQNGLKTVDQGGNVTINASSNADIVNLFDNGTVDAALVPEPWATTIENGGNATVLLDYNELFLNGNYPSALVIASGDFISEHPELVAEFLEMHKDTTRYINEDSDEALALVNAEIEKATGKSIDTAIIQNAFTRIEATADLNKDAVMTFARISLEEGLTNTIPEEKDVFNTELRE